MITRITITRITISRTAVARWSLPITARAASVTSTAGAITTGIIAGIDELTNG
jgi:hypothetical protein